MSSEAKAVANSRSLPWLEICLNDKDLDEAQQAALDVLKRNLVQCDLGRPMNILLLGTKGVGKSSFLNTLAAALTNTFAARAQFGESGGDADNTTLTTNLTCFRNMGVEDFEMDELRAKIGWNTEPMLLPNIFDIPGLPTSENKGYVEVIRRVLYGLVDVDCDLQYLYNVADTLGELGIEKEIPMDSKIDPHIVASRRIDRVVIIMDALNEPEEGFLKTVLEAVCPRQENFHGDRFPYFCIITKTDRITETDLDVFEDRKARLISRLQMTSAEHMYCKYVVNYNDKTATRREPYGYAVNPRLNLSALRALCVITNPHVKAPRATNACGRVAHRRRMARWRQGITAFRIFQILSCLALVFIAWLILRWAYSDQCVVADHVSVSDANVESRKQEQYRRGR